MKNLSVENGICGDSGRDITKLEEDSIRFYFLWACCQGKIERIGGETIRDDTVFFA